MENNIQIFKNEQFGEVRGILINNEPYFVGKDVANLLGYADTSDALKKHVDDEDKMGRQIADSLGRVQTTKIINESGLYSLILSSKLPGAKKFKRWVTSEVLPQIRKTGLYQIPKISKELQAIFMLDNRTEKIESEVKNLKDNMPLFNIECDELQKEVRKIGVTALGGKESSAYKDKSVRTKVYTDIQHQVKRQFDVRSYKAIKRCQLEIAKEIINNYELPFVLEREIEAINNQLAMEEVACTKE